MQSNYTGRQAMNQELLMRLLQDIDRENIRYGSCEVKFTFHDGRIDFYELTTHKRHNMGKDCKVQNHRCEAMKSV